MRFGQYPPDSPEWVCTLSVRGQNVLVFTPWLWLLAGVTATFASAVIAAKVRRTPLFGIPIGIIAYLAALPIGFGITDIRQSGLLHG